MTYRNKLVCVACQFSMPFMSYFGKDDAHKFIIKMI